MPAGLSVIIPALNEADGIDATLASLQPLRARGHQILVVDGGSTDGTPDRAARRADRVLRGPRGRARQMAAGVAASHGTVLWFVHADTVMPPDADLTLLAALTRGGSRWGRFDVTLAGRHPLLPVIAAAMNLRSRLTGIATGDQGLFVTRTLYDAAGGFPDQPLMEDIALSRRLKAHGPPACLRARLLTSARRWERDGVARTIALMWRLRLAYALGADPALLAQRYYG
ncbi:MAG: TIGR04283 family arsenosugar biosynthesis glycosyltransferase [Gammaproteobacteria bacterium]